MRADGQTDRNPSSSSNKGNHLNLHLSVPYVVDQIDRQNDLIQGDKYDSSVENIFCESLPWNIAAVDIPSGSDINNSLEKDYVSYLIDHGKDVNKEASGSSMPSTERLDKQGHIIQGTESMPSMPESSYSISPLLEDRLVPQVVNNDLKIVSKFWADQVDETDDSISTLKEDDKDNEFTPVLSKSQKELLRRGKNVKAKTHNTRARAGYKNVV